MKIYWSRTEFKQSIFFDSYVVVFPAIAAYYCWQKGVQIIGPNRSTMFVQLMPLFSAVMAIIIFKENLNYIILLSNL